MLMMGIRGKPGNDSMTDERRGRDGEESGGSGSVISGNMIFAEATSHHKDTRLTSDDRTDAGSQADQERDPL